MMAIFADSPLEWPEGLKRAVTPQPDRFKCSFAGAYDHVRAELKRMGVDQGRITATMLLRNDGLPYAEQRTTGEPGVAVYFKRGATEFVIAIDRYKKLSANMRAAAHVLEAYRTIERHGGRRLALQALEGFRALTPGQVLALPAAPWWRVLGFPEIPDDLATVLSAYRGLLRRGGHPDHGSPPEEFRFAAQAVAEAREHFAGKGARG
jgi:hypothetical protein